MFRTRRSSVVPALLIAAVLLMVGLAGTATAAKLITGKEIKNNTVTTQDIKNHTLTGSDVKDGALSAKDLNGTAKAKLNKPAVVGYEVLSETFEADSGSDVTAVVGCSAGKVALTGGHRWSDPLQGHSVMADRPMKKIGDLIGEVTDVPGNTIADAWGIDGHNDGLNPQDLTVYVVCVNPN